MTPSSMPEPVSTIRTSPVGSFQGPASAVAHQKTPGVNVTRRNKAPRVASDRWTQRRRVETRLIRLMMIISLHI